MKSYLIDKILYYNFSIRDKDYYKQITPKQLRINSNDLRELRKFKRLTQNAKETLYFYLISLKKYN